MALETDAAAGSPPEASDQGADLNSGGVVDNSTSSPGSDGTAVSQDDKSSANTSGAEKKDDKEKPSMFDEVRKALDKTKEGKKEESSTSSSQATDKAATKTDPSKDGKVDEADVPKEFNNHPAWKRIITERDKARSDIETYKGAAQNYQNVENYLKSNGISTDEGFRAWELTAMSKKDPEKFFAELSDLYYTWGATLGKDILPPDLQKQVEEGLITSDLAKEHAVLRARSNQATKRQEMQDASAVAEAQRNTTIEATNALQGWQKAARLQDPDFDKKHGMIERYIKSIVSQEGPPKTSQGYVEIAKRAHAAVNADLQVVTPKPANIRPAKNPSPQSGGAPKTSAPAPKNTFEAVQRGLEISRAG